MKTARVEKSGSDAEAARRGRVERALLRLLALSDGPMGAARLAEGLADQGIDLKPRAVRYHLRRLDLAGLTRLVDPRHGRVLTESGQEEARRAGLPEKVGFVASLVDDLGYRMTFDVRTGTGSVVVNAAVLAEGDLPRAVQIVEPVLRARLGMGSRLMLARADGRVGDQPVPRDCAALGSVCSVTVNGILLKYGVPVVSRYAGLLEMADGRPTRFLDLIEYRGITCDPLELFVRAGLTRVLAVARTGGGVVGASFREVPAAALEEVRRVARILQARDLPVILDIGRPGRPLLGVAVAEGRVGMVVLGGLNVFAALHESGIAADIWPLAGLADIAEFRPFRDIALYARRESPLID